MSEEKKLWRVFKNNKTAFLGTLAAGIIVMIACVGPWISPYDPLEQDVFHRLRPPGSSHLLGTDEYGRDVLSRVIWAARISLAVSLLSVLFGMVIGTAMGLLGGFIEGIPGMIIMRIVDVLLSFPVLITGIMVIAVLGSGMLNLIITMGIVFAPRFARLAYGPTLAVREMDYVSAARVIGASNSRIIVLHIFPNIFGELLVAGTLWLGAAIIIEASLSFLGLGVAPPTPTWGNMIKGGIDRLSEAPWLTISPGLAILITVLAFNMIGDGLRDITDPRLRD